MARHHNSIINCARLCICVEELQYTQSTRVSVPSSELVPPHSFPPQRVCLPPWIQRGREQHSLAGEGVGGPIRTTGQKARHSVYAAIIFILSSEDAECHHFEFLKNVSFFQINMPVFTVPITMCTLIMLLSSQVRVAIYLQLSVFVNVQIRFFCFVKFFSKFPVILKRNGKKKLKASASAVHR